MCNACVTFPPINVLEKLGYLFFMLGLFKGIAGTTLSINVMSIGSKLATSLCAEAVPDNKVYIEGLNIGRVNKYYKAVVY